MDHDKGPTRRDSEVHGGPGSGSFIWYLVAVGLVMLLLTMYLFKNDGDNIEFTEFERLVQKCALDESENNKQVYGENAYHEITDSRDRKVRYSNLTNVIVDTDEVRAAVDKELVPEDGNYDRNDPKYSKKEDVRIRVYKNPTDHSEQRVTTLLAENNIPFSYAPGPTLLTTYGPLLLVTTVILLLFFVMMRRLGGAGSPMAFGRSRGRMYAQEDLGVTFDDAAGIEEAVEEVREIVDFLQLPEKYRRLGGRIPKGVLLVGPPGTGKTLLAKAIAGEASVPFFSLSGSDFVEMFVGVGAARVRDMFRQAEVKAPCIIFIDELDALGKTRGTGVVGGHDEREQTLNALLVEMDGFDSNKGVIVLAATNRPEMLDPALLRPGRFDRNILVDRPDVSGREDILKVHVKNVKLDPSVDLKHVASFCSGFAGADLANLVNEAALLAARKDKDAVSLEEFNEAVERVTAGLEKKQRVMSEEEKQRVAYHESGHALVAFSLPDTDPVHKVSIIPRGMAALGYTMQRPVGDRYLMTQTELESRIQILLAGTVAEEMTYTDISTGAQNDLKRATEIARSMVMDYGMSQLGRVNYQETSSAAFLTGAGEDRARNHSEETAREIDQETKRIIDAMIEKVRHILAARRPALEALAKELMEFESMDSDKLQQLIEESSPGPVLVPGTTGATKWSADEDKDQPSDSSRIEGSR